ncbi:MAG: DUF3801 domain-containing protein [Oscillospiraceae bacterium]|jgi:hypothetical protein|nr:DUF3801 domain-containing protein [Oscillospiraceae bacterium]
MSEEMDAVGAVLKFAFMGGEYAFKIGGALAKETVALIAAVVKKALAGNNSAKKKIADLIKNAGEGGATFVQCKPEQLKDVLKHFRKAGIEYNVYDNGKVDGTADISVKNSDVSRIARVYEKLGVGEVKVSAEATVDGVPTAMPQVDPATGEIVEADGAAVTDGEPAAAITDAEPPAPEIGAPQKSGEQLAADLAPIRKEAAVPENPTATPGAVQNENQPSVRSSKEGSAANRAPSPTTPPAKSPNQKTAESKTSSPGSNPWTTTAASGKKPPIGDQLSWGEGQKTAFAAKETKNQDKKKGGKPAGKKASTKTSGASKGASEVISK